MVFCNKHRLPENHNCPFDLRKKDIDYNLLDETHLLYQDALEYMSGELTVAKIYDYVTTNSITKSEAIELLNYFIENSENSEIRKVSILAFKILNLKSDRAYNILESCLLSDEDPEVKKTTKNVILYNFPKKSRDLLIWVRKHDNNLKEES